MIDLRALLTIGLLAAAAGSCGDPEPDEDVVLGLIAPITNSPRLAGRLTAEGAGMAIDEINAAGGVRLASGRRTLRMLVEDNEDRPEMAVSKAFKLVEADRAVALLGAPLSHNAIAVARVAEVDRVPFVSTLSTHPDTTRDRSWAFRLAFLDSTQGTLMADFAVDELGARTAAALVDAGSPYSASVGREFAAAFERRGGSVAAFETYTVDDLDQAAQLDRIHAARPDVLFLPSYARHLPLQARAARQRGITATLLGADAWDVLPPASKAELAGAYYCDIWSPNRPDARARDFIARYRELYAQAPTSAAALAYDAVFLIAEALERAGSPDRASLRRELATASYFGVTGAIHFDGGGDPRRAAVIKRILEDGSTSFFLGVAP